MPGWFCPSFTMRRPTLNLLLIGGLIAALLAGIGLSHWLQKGAGEVADSGLILSQPRPLPEFTLRTQHGMPYTRDSHAEHWQLLFFGFTHCPDICPNTLALMRQLKRDLPVAVREQLAFVFVTVDPARDTVPVMRDYVAHFDPEFVGVTGSAEEVAGLTKAMGIAYLVNEADASGDYNVDHSTALVLLAPGGGIKAYFPAPHSLSALQQTLSRLIPS